MSSDGSSQKHASPNHSPVEQVPPPAGGNLGSSAVRNQRYDDESAAAGPSRIPDAVIARQVPVQASTHEPIVAKTRPKRRRLDAELAFSSPGPAFQVSMELPDGGSPIANGSESPSRPSRSLRARRSVTLANGNGMVSARESVNGGGSGRQSSFGPFVDEEDKANSRQSPSQHRSGSELPMNSFKTSSLSSEDVNMTEVMSSGLAVSDASSPPRQPSDAPTVRSRSRSKSVAKSETAPSSLDDSAAQPILPPTRDRPQITPVADLAGKLSFEEILTKRREEKAAAAQSDLEDVHESHDMLVRELFHLTKFVTMIGYDPEIARQDQSDVFTTFQNAHDLRFILDSANGQTSSSSGRTTRRRVNARLESLSLKRPAPPSPSPTTPTRSGQSSKESSKDSALKRARKSSSLPVEEDDGVLTSKRRADDEDRGESEPSSRNGQNPVSRREPSAEDAGTPQVTKTKRAGRKSKMLDDLDDFILRHRPRSLPEDPPSIRVLNPSQIPLKRRFGGDLEAFWNSFSFLHDESTSEQAAKEMEQAELDSYLRIDKSRRAGIVMDGALRQTARLSVHQDVRQKSHQDHMLEAISTAYTSMRQSAKARSQLAKRVSRMISQYWERQSGSSERERKAEEKRIRALAKWTVREVAKQWRLAVNVVRARKLAEEKAEKEKLDKEQLNAILQKSTEMLRKQQEEMIRIDSESGSERSYYDSEDELDEADDDLDRGAEEEETKMDTDRDGEILTERRPRGSVSQTPDILVAADMHVSVTEPPNEADQVDQTTEVDDEDQEVEQTRRARPRRNARSRRTAGSKSDAPDPDTDDVEFSANVDDQAQEDEELERQMWEEDEEDDSEDAGLAADADLPIEELLKRYGYGAEEVEPEAEESVQALDEGDDGRAHVKAEARDHEDDDDMSADEAVDAEEVKMIRRAAPAPAEEVEASSDLSDTESVATSSRRSLRRSLTRASSVVSSDRNVSRSRQPFLLRGQLRPYQQIGFEWLAGLYVNGMNGILADEMGLGKTIQTISLLAHLACDKGVWGPHLVIAPTSVMLNWEVEFKKFLPGFKILSYYGNQKERKEKRIGWNTENSFNVCITSYQLVLADQHIFRRKPWVYMVLDEAHHIKNFRSQRWQTLLGFNSQRRLLLTGTPLQNNLMDLWSLMYFLMPHGATDLPGGGAFANMKDFQDWFSNPLDKAIEGGTSMDEETRAMVAKLHTVLRPFLLRRLKSEVEKELPSKYEHVITCRLSKRQRFLYNDFMSRAKTRESLASGNYMSIINCLMQLRKVCNHPDLFEVRPIVTSFAMQRSVVADFEIKDLLVRRRLLQEDGWAKVDLDVTNFKITSGEQHLTAIESRDLRRLNAAKKLPFFKDPIPPEPELDTWTIDGFLQTREERKTIDAIKKWKHVAYINQYRCTKRPIYGSGLISLLREAGEAKRLIPVEFHESDRKNFLSRCDNLLRLVQSHSTRLENLQPTIDRFAFATPRAVATDMPRWALAGFEPSQCPDIVRPDFDIVHPVAVKLHIAFPDASLLQYDCGKLQQLDILMRRLKEGGHRILIFTQMTRVLDILESFLNYHGYRYLRLDGATKVEQRQALTEKFNRDLRISAFILSTRSGGLGINLTGADTVLFYDLDWNAAIESQCMDRAHRIGQTRDVHIYRFVTEHTIEENMLRKANQKRLLDSVVIQEGEFNTEALAKKIDWRDMLDEGGKLGDVEVGTNAIGASAEGGVNAREVEKAFLDAEDEEDRAAALAARQEMFVDESDFNEMQTLPTQVPQGQQAVSVSANGNGSRDQSGTPLPHDAETGLSTQQITEVQDDNEQREDEEEEEEGGTIDDYLLSFVEWDWEFFA